MLKKIIVLSVLAVSLTGCIIAPFDDGYDRGGYDHRGGSDGRWDNRRDDDRRGDRRGDDRRDDRDRPDWNWNGR